MSFGIHHLICTLTTNWLLIKLFFSAIKLEKNDSDIDDDLERESVAVFLESKNGNTTLQYDGFRYTKAYKTRNGFRWNCSSDKNCGSFVYLNDQDEIIMSSKYHDHAPPYDLSGRLDLYSQGMFFFIYSIDRNYI